MEWPIPTDALDKAEVLLSAVSIERSPIPVLVSYPVSPPKRAWTDPACVPALRMPVGSVTLHQGE